MTHVKPSATAAEREKAVSANVTLYVHRETVEELSWISEATEASRRALETLLTNASPAHIDAAREALKYATGVGSNGYRDFVDKYL